jgi:hypothetical protein
MHCGLRHDGADLFIERMGGYDIGHSWTGHMERTVEYHIGWAQALTGIVYPMYDYTLYQSCT